MSATASFDVLPRTVAHLLKAGDMVGGREPGEGCRSLQFTYQAQRYCIQAVKSGRAPWYVSLFRYRTQEEAEALCKQAGIHGNVFNREQIAVEHLPRGSRLPDVNRVINRVWGEFRSGK